MTDQPLTSRQCASVLAVLATLAVLTAALLWGTGCESFERLQDKPEVQSDPELLAVADAANIELSAAFHCPPAKDYAIIWGPVGGGSYAGWGNANGGRVITIDSKYDVPGVNVRWVVRHEMFHVISGLSDSAVTFNGIRIADVIPGWGE